MKVYGPRMSPFVRKVLAVLDMKSLAYEVENVMPGDSSPAFRAISPLGKVPGFTEGDLALADSTVICEYLDEQYPQASSLPAEPGLRARARWLEEYADTKLAELLGAGVFFERVVKPVFMKQEPDLARVEKTINDLLPPALDYLESQSPADGFFCGAFGRADISVVSAFINAEYAEYQVDASRWPKLAALIERVKTQPAFKAQLDAENVFVPALLGKTS